MKRMILLCIFALSLTSMSLAQTNSTESLTITTYYPSPYGVYNNLKLNPTDAVPNGSALSPGVMYYDNGADKIVYYNKTGSWVDLAGGGGGGGGGNDTYWSETSAHHIYNNNTGFVGIGNQTPELPLVVQMSNAQSANATVGNFTKNLGGLEQSLLFNLYPNNAWTSYLNSTSVVYSPENLEVAVGNQTNHVRFNIGGYHSSYSEVMRLVNPNGSHNTSDPPDPRVGIGTVNPLFTLHVETDTELTGPLMVRGMIAGKKTGIFNIIPYKDRVYLGFGMYGLNGHFYNDPYYDFLTGTNSKNGAKLCIRPNQGVYWFAYGPSDITVSNNRINDWTVFPGSMTDGKLWDIHGTWICPACPSSSRTLKENFAAINLEDILGKIDQLEVPRWNYKSDNRSVTHIGPMAEDFYSLFKTGSRESQLHLIDSAGVSLAGVKALLAKANRQEQRLEELGREIEDLKVQLSKKRARK